MAIRGRGAGPCGIRAAERSAGHRRPVLPEDIGNAVEPGAVAHSETIAPSLRHLDQFQPLHIRPRDIRGLGPVSPEHHRHAPLRVVAGGIVVASDLLA